MSDFDSDMTGVLLGRYRVEATLGEGAFGTVVRAFDTRLKRTVAIKTLKRPGSAEPADIERFRSIEERFAREAEAGSRMGIHPNLVTVHDLVVAPDRTQYLILEYVRGGTLADRLARGPLARGDALRLAADVARGLQAAHEVGIVHRDVKPANIFLGGDGRAQLGDFGIAQIDDVSGRTHTTMQHPGTPLYMSPEQVQTTGYVRPASDQYSLGLVLFEMLTGAAYKRIGARAAAERLADQPAPVADLIAGMTAPDPDDRLPSCGHVARQIQVILRQLGEGETHLAPSPDTASPRVGPRPPGTPSEGGGTPPGDVVAPPGTARLAVAPRPPLAPDASRGRIAVGIGAALVLLLLLGVGAARILGGTPPQVTQSPPPPATAVAAAVTATSAPTAVPTAIPTIPPTEPPRPTATVTSAPTATPLPPTPQPTIAPTVPPTAPPPTPIPPSPIAVYSVGTTNADLETVNGDDVVTAFTEGQEVYGFINYGGARVNEDVLVVTLVANGAPQPPQSFTMEKGDGFRVFPLGKLGAGDYRVEVRYAGKIAQAADFRVSSPPATARPPTAAPRTNPGGGTSPTAAQPTAVTQPTTAPVATTAPKPTAYIPPTQPPPKT